MDNIKRNHAAIGSYLQQRTDATPGEIKELVDLLQKEGWGLGEGKEPITITTAHSALAWLRTVRKMQKEGLDPDQPRYSIILQSPEGLSFPLKETMSQPEAEQLAGQYASKHPDSTIVIEWVRVFTRRSGYLNPSGKHEAVSKPWPAGPVQTV